MAWRLTGRPDGAGQCEECGRQLVHRWEVTSDSGERRTVGRGCLKAVTGWTLTAAQAAREARMIEVRARRAARWAVFERAHPREAAAITADCEAFAAAYNMATVGGGAPHEVKHYIENGERDLMRLVGAYMGRRRGFPWAT